MRKMKGFTLIEIMIVIVILAILATMVLPKMLAAPESAYLAEANAHIGAMARAQDTYMQMTGYAAAGCTAVFNYVTKTWTSCTGSLQIASDATRGCVIV